MSNCDVVAGSSLIALAASRLALRAPALRAATTLTRPNRSARGLPCSRHGVPPAVVGGPSDVVTPKGVEHDDHLTHPRHDDDLRKFPGGRETVVEGLEHGIPIAATQRRHIEHL